MSSEEKFLLYSLGALVLLLVVSVGVRVTAMSQCLEAGYPDSKMDLTFTRYCIKRVNQTDTVVPLRDLQP